MRLAFDGKPESRKYLDQLFKVNRSSDWSYMNEYYRNYWEALIGTQSRRVGKVTWCHSAAHLSTRVRRPHPLFSDWGSNPFGPPRSSYLVERSPTKNKSHGSSSRSLTSA